MRLATVAQSREIDALSQKSYHLSGEVLMEAAGALASRELEQAYFPELNRGLCVVVCGPGNNGGDGLVLARHLHSAGRRDVAVLFKAPKRSRRPLFELQLERAELQGLHVVDLEQEPEKVAHLQEAELIVDALFGIGLNGAIGEEFAGIVEQINSSPAPTISLDCPSGLDCDRGICQGPTVQATMTLTFGLGKPGFYVSEGPSMVGRLRVLPIGFPFEVLRGVATSHFLFNERLARRYLPRRSQRSNKSDHGHLLVLAGQPGMWGAGVLCSSAAYRLGAGYVSWCAGDEEPLECLKDNPEILTVRADAIWKKSYAAVAVGPGLGVGDFTKNVIQGLIERQHPAVVLDADAITVVAKENLFPLPQNWILTPHAAELSRIIGWSVERIQADRFAAALAASAKTGCHVLLKGYRTVIAYGARCMVIQAGNAALAKAGTGDVLTGMMGALLAQGLEPIQAASTAAYIHGRMADEWVRVGNDQSALTAGDLRDHLPQLMSRIRGGSLL